jgi:hypothetical protein
MGSLLALVGASAECIASVVTSVGRSNLTLSKFDLKARLVSAIRALA